MANNIPYEKITHVSPDSLRAVLKLNKHLFDEHVNDIVAEENYATQEFNTGTVKNFGSELLIESREIPKEKPSLHRMIGNNSFESYFDFQWSDLLTPSDKAFICEATLKPNMMLNRKFVVKFQNIREEVYLHAHSSSDGDVYKQSFYVTSTPPVLLIYNGAGALESSHRLAIVRTETIYGFLYQQNITTYAKKTGTTLEVTLSESCSPIPYVWLFDVESFYRYKTPVLSNNEDDDERPILPIGCDGYGDYYMYPGVYDNFPLTPGAFDIKYIKCYTSNDDPFNVSNTSDIDKHGIVKIVYACQTGVTATPSSEWVMQVAVSGCKLTLDKSLPWVVKSKEYAIIEFSKFVTNKDIDGPLKHMLRIRYDEKLSRFDEYDEQADSVVGFHADAGSQTKNNSIKKSNQLVYGFDEFDGLPAYFTPSLRSPIYNIHAELYAVSSLPFKYINQRPYEKHTSGLIFDTGVPNNTFDTDVDKLGMSIMYNGSRKFITKYQPISINNALSQLVYVDDNTMSTSTISKYELNRKFVYHGNRYFSLTKTTELDKESEIGRVFVISNDSTEYINNLTGLDDDLIKPKRTIARICDIPTDYMQLVQYVQKSPSLLDDVDYNRCGCDYSTSDALLLLNGRHDDVAHKGPWIRYGSELNNVLDNTYMSSTYRYWVNVNLSLDMATAWPNSFTYTWIGGSGYVVNDIISITIGGVTLKFKIKHLTNNAVDSLEPFEWGSSSIPLNQVYFKEKSNTYKVVSVSSNGSNAKLKLTLKDTPYANLARKDQPATVPKYTFAMDNYKNLWIYKYDHSTHLWTQDYQVTGSEIIDNPYDSEYIDKRGVKDVFIKHVTNPSTFTSITKDIVGFRKISSRISYTKKEGADTSYYVERFIANRNAHANELIFTYDDPDEPTKIDVYSVYQKFNGTYTDNYFPRFNRFKIGNYYDHSNSGIKLFVDNNGYTIPIVYNPTKDYLETYNPLTRDTRNKMTLVDWISNSNILDDNGIIHSDVYVINDTYVPETYENLKEMISTADHQYLINYIQSNFGLNAEPLLYESTEGYKWSDERLRRYILQNAPTLRNIYNNGGSLLLRDDGERVVTRVDNNIKPVGKQPTGGYEVLINRYHNNKLINNVDIDSNKLTFVRLDGYIGSLNDLVIRKYMNNINKSTIIVYDGKMFGYVNNNWVAIQSENEE